MDALELARWTRFAAKGGIGKCMATRDCVAERPEDLMFLKDDEIIVLMQIPDQPDLYLGFCEDVVGRFKGEDVQFHSKLKKPVMTKRTSSSGRRPSSGRSSSAKSPIPTPFSEASTPSSASSPSDFVHVNMIAASPSPHMFATPDQSPPASPPPPPIVRTTSSSPTQERQPKSANPSPTSPRRFRFPRQPILTISNPDESSPSREPSPVDDDQTFVIPLRTQSLNYQQDANGSIRDHSGQGVAPDVVAEAEEHAEGEHADAETYTPITQPEGSPMDMSLASVVAPTALPSRVDSIRQIRIIHGDEEDSRMSTFRLSQRVSAAPSEGDGMTGIGLSLLQNMLGGDSASSLASSSDTESGDDELGRSRSSTASSRYSDADAIQTELAHDYPGSHVDAENARPRTTSVSHSILTSSSRDGAPSRASNATSHDWDGASIYDQYTYRHSVASKMSRFSTLSGFGAGPLPEEAPPMPRPSTSRQNSVDVISPTAKSSPTSPSAARFPTRDASQSPTAVSPEISRGSPLRTKGRPEPLTLTTSGDDSSSPSPEVPLTATAPLRLRDKPSPFDLLPSPSPLLHTSFASPMMSPTAGYSAVTPPTSSLPFSDALNVAGAASALRARLEGVQPTPSPALNLVIPAPLPPPDIPQDRTGRDIVVVDDESFLPSALATPSSVPSSPLVPGPPSPFPTNELFPPNSVTSPPSRPSPLPDNFLPNVAAPSSPAVSAPALPPDTPYLGYSRSSMFLPHPSAPRATTAPVGPLYGRAQFAPHPYAAPPPTQEGSLHYTIRQALGNKFHPNGALRRMTIYGRCEADMTTAAGPVPISFSLEPPASIPKLMMQNRAVAAPQMLNEPSAAPPTSPRAGLFEDPAANHAASIMAQAPPAPGQPIPRQNFSPRTGTARPRSRSFSGFDKGVVEMELRARKQSQEEPAGPPRGSMPPTRGSTTPSRTSSPASGQPPVGRTPSSRLAISHGPSPLSLPPSTGGLTDAQPARSSLGNSPRSSGLRHATSSIQLRGSQPPAVATEPVPRAVHRSNSMSGNMAAFGAAPTTSSPLANPTPRTSSEQASSSKKHGVNGANTGSLMSASRRPSGDVNDTRSVLTPPPLIRGSMSSEAPSREPSLRSKLSNLGSAPVTPDEPQFALETVQVKDTGFELVKPVLPAANGRASSDSLALSFAESKGHDSRFLRAGSPSMSMLSGGTSSPIVETFDPSALPKSPTADSPTAADAHRQRELRWVSLMSATPPAQARKSKKVRKLVIEGVPASVRHLVWASLANSSAKRMDGLYAKLGKRGRVPASSEIDRDVQKYFSDQAQMTDPLSTMLQAYLTMVPDIRYNTGLCLIAGHLLQQAPEEDAFWIFVSIMDTHLRSYFSNVNVQADVDGTLFGKALEANDPALLKKFAEMQVTPSTLCRHWFSSMFVTTLPLNHLSRVWDVFLAEGVPFLFRAALALTASCRRLLLDARSRDAFCGLLFQPPPDILPPSPEAFISLAHSMKLKDDDVAKTRTKMEAQLKKQAQARLRASTPNGNAKAPSISLPRT